MPFAVMENLAGSSEHSASSHVESTVAHQDLHGSANMEVYNNFLSSRPLHTSFDLLNIKFYPKVKQEEPIAMPCEQDQEVCEEQCRTLYAARPELMEKPCMEAVQAHFGYFGPSHGMCFPGVATVQARGRGTIRISDVVLGDELWTSNSSSSRVVALLHNNSSITEVYLQIRYDTPAGDCNSLLVSPQHLVRTRVRGGRVDDSSGDRGLSSMMPIALDECIKHGSKLGVFKQQRRQFEGAWTAAEDIRPDDELLDENGLPVKVRSIGRVCLVGAYAPLTASGELLVNGVLCSCYSPPTAWMVPHGACHASMLPVRLLDTARVAVERLTRSKDSEVPFFTVDCVWLLPRMEDETLHPWASGLLRTAMCTQSLALQCKAAITGSSEATTG